MKVFMLGLSRTGKTPVAEAIAAELGYELLPAGGWAKHSFTTKCSTMDEYVRRLTRHSVEKLQTNFTAGLDHLRALLLPTGSYVIDGERNPYDFIHLFDPATDFAIVLSQAVHTVAATGFELGVEVIGGYLDWLHRNRFIAPGQYRSYQFEDLYARNCPQTPQQSLEANIHRIVDQLRRDLALDERPTAPPA